jgi:hypothetical protein
MDERRKASYCYECQKKYDEKRGPYNEALGRHAKLNFGMKLSFAEEKPNNLSIPDNQDKDMNQILLNGRKFVVRASRERQGKTALREGFASIGQTAITINGSDAGKLSQHVEVASDATHIAIVPSETKTNTSLLLIRDKKSPSRKVSLPASLRKEIKDLNQIVLGRKKITWLCNALLIPLY